MRETKKKPVKKKIPKTVQESIPFLHAYKNGVIETEPGVFTKAYRMPDADFTIASLEMQDAVFGAYESFLDSFHPGSKFQILIRNEALNKREFLKSIRLEPQEDGLNQLRKEVTKLQVDAIAKGGRNLTQVKTIIVAVHGDSVDEAMKSLEAYDSSIPKALAKIAPLAPQVEPMTLDERIKDLFNIYNMDGTNVLENTERDGEPAFDAMLAATQGLSLKDCIAPGGLHFAPTEFEVGLTHGKSHYLGKAPNMATTNFLGEIMDLPYRLAISIQIIPIHKVKAARLARNSIMNIQGSISDDQKKAGEKGYSAALTSPEKYDNLESVMTLMDKLMKEDQNLFNLSMTVTVFGDTSKEVEQASRALMDVGNRHFFPIQPLTMQHEQGFNSSLPLCINEIKIGRQYTTEAAAVLLPYTSQDLHMRKGLWYGINKITHSPIVYARNAPTEKNAHGMIIGSTGSGKSFTAKYEMLSALLRSPNNVVYVIDPQKDYTPLAKAVGGTILDIGVNTSTYLNPMDMDINYGGSVSAALQDKSSYIISMIELMMTDRWELTPKEKSIIDRCVSMTYEPYIRHVQALQHDGINVTYDKDASPRLSDLCGFLRAQRDADAQYLADVLGMYANGTQGVFAYRSNVDSDARMLVYDISSIGSGVMLPLSLFVALNDIQVKTKANKEKGLWTWIYIDEFHKLTASRAAMDFAANCWRMYRKMNGVLTAISQSVADMPDAIRGSSNMCILLSLSEDERQVAGDYYKLSERQLDYINDADKGSGLIVCGQGRTAIPFENTIPEESPLFNMMTTTQTTY